MKKINYYLSFIAVFALLFSSCSKDEEPGVNPDSDKATLSFGAVVQDLANKGTNKQSEIGDMPACSDDTAAYVEIVLMQGENEVVGSTEDPFRVDLVAGQLFTEEVPELELEPGSYSLEHFSVYNADGDLIWLAPKGGVLAQFVDSPLPLDINLGAGVKKYVDVSVICYDDRNVNEYGYMFFELDLNEAFEFCFFANYCTPEGRHFPASFSVDISIDGETLYSGEMNTTGINNDGDFYADPLCLALPNIADYADDEEYIDYTITLRDWEGAYGDVEQMVQTGSLSRAEIMANFDGDNNVEYEHIRFGCEDDGESPADSDNDGVINSEDNCPSVANTDQADTDNDGIGNVCDQCPNEAGSASNNGCADTTDADEDGIKDSEDNCPNVSNANQADDDGDGVGNVCDNCPNTSNPNQVDSDGDGTGDACEENEVADCIPSPNAGCQTSDTKTLTVNDGFALSQEQYGDITINVDDSTGDVTVGVTPVAPYELNDLQVYIDSESIIECFTTSEPDEGVTGTVPGDFDNSPFDVEVTVNFCNVEG